MIGNLNTDKFKIFGIFLFILSLIDTYFLITYEHLSQLFWFCNTGLYLLAAGFYFRKSIILTGVLIGALVVQIPWVLDFLVQLFFGYSLFGVTSYMFDYGFSNVRFYIELDHLLIIPLSVYGVYTLGFHKHGWIFAVIVTFIVNMGAFIFSSAVDNINCVFYSCFDSKINVKEHALTYVILWTLLLSFVMFLVGKIIYLILKRKNKSIS